MRQLAACAAVVLAGAALAGDVIEVAPGSGTISAAAAGARAGDTLRLAPGEYSDSVELGEGVTLEGAGADRVTITGTGYAAINCTGARATVRGVTIKGGEETTRGINTSLPLRVERCRFLGVKEAVAMMGAPLSDVVACEFVDCGIGVRAIGEACPTVWGCRFQGGNIGVFSMGGAPYVRNNAFVGQRAGMRMAVDAVQQAIVRNNLFLGCTEAGIELIGKEAPIIGPSIRNNIFAGTALAAKGESAFFGATSHCLVAGAGAFAGEGGPLADLDARSITVGECGAGVDASGAYSCADDAPLAGKGLRSAEEAHDAVGRIGPELDRMGVAATAELPPVRFNEGSLIANAVMEEYQYLETIAARMHGQASGMKNGRNYDRMECALGGRQVQIEFDISRFYGEMGMP